MISRCSSVVVAALVLALAAPALHAQAPTVEADARTIVEAQAAAIAQQGIDLFKQGKYVDALAAFEKSLQLAPVPVVAWNLARCHEELEHPDEAIRAFERFRDLSPEDDKKQIAATKIERLLQRYYATLSLAVEPAGAEVLLDGTSVGLAPLKNLRVTVGTHDVELRLAGYEPQRRVVQVAPGQAFAFTFTLWALPAMVVIEAPEPVGGLVVLVDGVRVPQVAAPARFQVTPGVHTVDVQAGPDWLALHQTVTVGAGDEAKVAMRRAAGSVDGGSAGSAPVVVVKKDPAVRLIDETASAPARSYRTVAGVLLGVGLAAAGAGGVVHVVGYARWKDVTDAKTDDSGHVTGVTRAHARDVASATRLKYTIAYGLYGLGAAAVTTSIVFYALDASDSASVSVGPLAWPSGAGVSFSGRF